MTEVDPAALVDDELDPADVARLIADLPEETLRGLLTGEVVPAACDQIIRRFPEYVDAERTRGVTAAVGWLIEGDDGTERFTVFFNDGEVTAGRDLGTQLRVTLELDAVDFLRLATGNADPTTLFLSGASRCRATSCSRSRWRPSFASPVSRARPRVSGCSTRPRSTRPGSPRSSGTRRMTRCGAGCPARSGP